MKRSVFLNLAVAFVMALMLVVPHQSLAFRAPDEDTTMTRDDFSPPGSQLRDFRAPGLDVPGGVTSLAPKLGLRSILIRDLNQSVTGDLSRTAKEIVESLINRQVSDEQQSLSRDGLSLSNDLKIIGFEAQLRKTQVDSLGYTHIRMTQHYQGLPVVGAEIIVHINDRDVLYQINGKYLPAVKVSIEPSIGANDALQIGLDEQQGKAGVYVSKEPSLVIFGGRLAYHYVISYDAEEVGQWWYYVDAHTGKLIYRYNNIQQAAPDETKGNHTSVEGDRLTGEDGSHVSMTGFYENAGTGNYFLYNFNDVWGIYDWAAGDWEQRSSQNWGTTDQHAISGGLNFSLTQDYVSTVLGRNSFDDAGAFARANVHQIGGYCPNNAWWDGSDFHFCDGDGSTYSAFGVMDIAAHEYGHAVTTYTSNLIYSYESGALNESYSDIMGALVEFTYQPDGRAVYPDAIPGYSDWLCGEDAKLPDSDDALRDFRDPHRYQQPSYYHGTHWYSGSGDNGGVHTNSGVQNFAFYLLAEGGSGDNDGHPYGPITGLGIADAGEVAMYANMYLLTPSSQYVDSRQAWFDAAAVLGYPTATVEQVWDAVGVGGGPDNLIESFPSPSTASIGLDYDDARNGVWVTGEDGFIYLVAESPPHAVLKTINLVGIAIAGDGNTDGVCVLSNGNLLLTDYNGDLANIDDYLFEIDPDTETLVNYWPVDGSWNTSTDGTSINTVIGVEIGPSGHAFVTSASGNNIYEIALIPGSPGTWSTVAVHTATTVSNVLGIDRIDCPDFGGWLVGDWNSTTVAILDNAFSTTNSFAANHDGNGFNTGVTAISVPGDEPIHVWTTDYSTEDIGVFDSGVMCGSAEGATIYGTVTDIRTGRPIRGVNIIAWHEDGATVERTRTNFPGYYELSDLKAGKWRLRAQRWDYEVGRLRPVDVSPGGNYEENFRLFRLMSEKR